MSAKGLMIEVMIEDRIMGSLRRDGVEAPPSKRVTTGDAADSEPHASACAVSFDSFDGVLRAARLEPARRQMPEPGSLVGPDEADEESAERAQGISLPPARLIASVTRLLSSWNETSRMPDPTPMRYVPAGSSATTSRTTTRSRRR